MVDQSGSAPLVYVQHLASRVCSSPLLCPASTAAIDREGRRVNWTSQHSDWQRGADVQGHTPVHPWVIWLKWRRYEWSLVIRSLPPWSRTQRPRPFSRRLPDSSLPSRTLVAVFGWYTDLLTADVGCTLYIDLQIFTLWQKSKVGVRLIFDGILYSMFYGI